MLHQNQAPTHPPLRVWEAPSDSVLELLYVKINNLQNHMTTLNNFHGNPTIPRVWLIGCEFGVKTSAKKWSNYPFWNTGNDEFFVHWLLKNGTNKDKYWKYSVNKDCQFVTTPIVSDTDAQKSLELTVNQCLTLIETCWGHWDYWERQSRRWSQRLWKTPSHSWQPNNHSITDRATCPKHYPNRMPSHQTNLGLPLMLTGGT